MKHLKEILSEGILGDIDDRIDNMNNDIKSIIEDFIIKNYNVVSNGTKYKISDKPNKDGKYEVSVRSRNMVKFTGYGDKLTNGSFVWTKVNGSFDCSYSYITSLEGSPKYVGIDFNCNNCKELKSLEGSPETVKGSFICRECTELE